MCIDWVSKVRLDKTARCLSVWGQTKPVGIKLQYFCQYGDKKKRKQNNQRQRRKLSIYMLDTIESESTTRFKNRSSDRMMTSDWLIDISDDRYTTNDYIFLLSDWLKAWDFFLIELYEYCLSLQFPQRLI